MSDIIDIIPILDKYFSDDLHYRARNILEQRAIYNIMMSSRNDGKSYQVKHFCALDAMLNNRQFVYMRRYGTEMAAYDNTSYWLDCNYDMLKKVCKKFAREQPDFDTIEYYSGRIWLVKYSDTKKTFVKQIGRTSELATMGHHKSSVFLNCHNVIFEEFLTNEGYLIGEPSKFQHSISTFLRDVTGRAFLLGNPEVRFFPYQREWGLTNIGKIKEKEIQIYHHDGVKIACELCENTAKKRGADKMFFGKAKANIVDGEWSTHEVPHLPTDYRLCKSLYKMTLAHETMKYRLEVLQNGDELYLYIYPCTDRPDTRRLITKEYNGDWMQTPYMQIVTQGDKLIVELLKRNRVFYADNLTGTEIESIAGQYNLTLKRR